MTAAKKARFRITKRTKLYGKFYNSCLASELMIHGASLICFLQPTEIISLITR